MKKRIISLALALVLAAAVMPVSLSAVTATPNAATVYVDGSSVAFDAYTINQENYFKLRDVMYTFMGTRSQFNAIFDTSVTPTVIKLTNGATYTPDGSEMQAKGTGSKTPNLNPYTITLDGKEINITAYEIDGNNYFKMRDLAIALNFYVGYDGAITIDTGRPYGGAPTPAASGRTYNMDDPNVKKHPIYATARAGDELRAHNSLWMSATERISLHKDPDNTLENGLTIYEGRTRLVLEWVDAYLSANGLSYQGKTDFEKTAIIRQIIEEGRMEELIGLWRPNFRFTEGDCGPRSEVITNLMVALDFELFRTIQCDINAAHITNAYWDATVRGVRFVDADLGFDVWNLFVDELYAKGFKLH